MCFAGSEFKNVVYVSAYTGEQSTYHTIKDVTFGGNYHYWVIDKPTGKIVDITPLQEPLPDNTEPIYIPWTHWEQQAQIRYNIFDVNRYYNYETDKELKRRFEQQDYKKGDCFLNSWALVESDPDRYQLVCGSFGFKLDETPDSIVYNLDYGY